MNPIEPAELSAYLDGELSPERAQEVEAALASSPALRTELKSLAADDARWRAAACSAAFRPDVRLPRARALGVRAGPTLLAVALLLGVRLLPKLVGTLTLALILNALALTVIMAWVLAMLRSTEDRPEISPVP